MTQQAEKQAPQTSPTARRMARLAAVQGLYQIDLTGEAPESVIRRFHADPSVFLQEDETASAVDKELVDQVVTGVGMNQGVLDDMISGAIDARLSAARLEPLLKAILRAGLYELRFCPQTATGIVINDYVDVAHSFFDAKEPGLVNAILDKSAKILRS